METQLIRSRLFTLKRLLITAMKTFFFLICTTMFCMSPHNSFSQEKVFIEKDQLVTIDQVFDIIKTQTNYDFIYPRDFFKASKKIRLQKEETTVLKLLEQSLLKNNYDFKIVEDNVIVISQNIVTRNDDKVQLMITGKITDNNGQPLLGVNIIVKGTTRGTVTDFNGSYEITANEGEVLEFSYLGFSPQVRTVGTSNVINVTLVEDSAKLNEVLVTASLRNEKLQNVASSITALTEAQLAQQNIAQFDDFVGQIPNISFTGNGPSNRQVILRGTSTSTYQQSATVATYIDDVPVGSSTALSAGSFNRPDVNVFDLDRLEVLRGPHGTRYGANSLGGLLKYVTKTPSLDGEASYDVRIGSSSSSNGGFGSGIDASANFPISQKTALRVSGFTRKDPGFIDNIGTGEKDINGIDNLGARLNLFSNLSDNLSLRATAMFQNVEAGGPTTVRIDRENGTTVFDDYEQERFSPENQESKLQLYALTFKYNLGNAILSSTTAYNLMANSRGLDWTRIEGGADSGFTGVVTFPEQYQMETAKWTQELRLSSLDNGKFEWALGVFMTGEKSFLTSLEQGLKADGTPGTEVPSWAEGQGTPANMFSSDWQSKFKQYSGYGELTYYLGPNFDVTGGVRYSHNETDFDQTLGGLWMFNGGEDLVYPHVNSKDNATTFMLSPRWRISDGTMIYVRSAQGFRPGGPNSLTPAAIEGGAKVEYESDQLTNNEIGIKTTSFNNSLFFDLTYFYIDWDNIQIRQISDDGFAYTGNGGKASSKGLELAVTAKPNDRLTLSFNLGTLDAKLDEDAPAVGAVKGDKLPNAADLTHGGYINYEFPSNNNSTFNIGGSWRHVGDRLSDLGESRTTMDGYNTFNLNAGLSFKNYVIQAYAKNFTNTIGIESISNFFSYGTISRPRTIGISLTAQF